MISPLPFSSLAIDTLLPGELSTSSTSGMASPTFTDATGEARKVRAGAAANRAVRAGIHALRKATMVKIGWRRYVYLESNRSRAQQAAPLGWTRHEEQWYRGNALLADRRQVGVRRRSPASAAAEGFRHIQSPVALGMPCELHIPDAADRRCCEAFMPVTGAASPWPPASDGLTSRHGRGRRGCGHSNRVINIVTGRPQPLGGPRCREQY